MANETIGQRVARELDVAGDVFVSSVAKQETAARIDAAVAEARREDRGVALALYYALERMEAMAHAALSGKPVRDAAETYGEAAHARKQLAAIRARTPEGESDGD